jgi:hypothetical protein
MDPVTTIVSSIISSIISAAIDAPPAQPPAPAYSSMARPFPADSLKGELLAPIENEIEISGKRFSRAPALQIRNEQNLIVMPASLQGTLPVRYQLDQMGSVWRVWILSSAESQ